MNSPEQLYEGLYQSTTSGESPSASLAPEFLYPEISAQAECGELHCSVTSIDERGRLAARTTVRRLGWAPGQMVSMEVKHGLVVMRRSRRGQRSPKSGYVVLPARIRNRVGLYAGDRVLLAASLDDEVLRVYPPRVLAAALCAYTPGLGRGQ
ncbi:AbrB/MazE/SpoVT family DNA-binding domain-containing protein [Nocardia rhamnosiphila]